MTTNQDLYYLKKAFEFARDYSQDANTQTGAKIVSVNGEEISSGANRIHYGFPNRYN